MCAHARSKGGCNGRVWSDATCLLVAGCAFISFSRWSEAEAAIEAVNGKCTLPGALNPVAVRFADAKPTDLAKVGEKRPLGGGVGGGMDATASKRQFVGPQMGMGYGFNRQGQGMQGNFGGMGMAGVSCPAPWLMS